MPAAKGSGTTKDGKRKKTKIKTNKEGWQESRFLESPGKNI